MAEQPVDKKARYSELVWALLESGAKKSGLNDEERKRIEEEIRALEETIPAEERKILEDDAREEFAAESEKEK